MVLIGVTNIKGQNFLLNSLGIMSLIKKSPSSSQQRASSTQGGRQLVVGILLMFRARDKVFLDEISLSCCCYIEDVLA